MREVHLKLLQYITAVVIFLLLAAHLVLMHMEGTLGLFGVMVGDPTEWGSVAERASSVGWAAFYIVFLAVALFHALYGLRGIIAEFSLSDVQVRVLNWALIAVGAAVFVYAVYIPISAL